jgi:hypothetical protein
MDTDTTTQPAAVDAEIVIENGTVSEVSPAEMLINLETTIKGHVGTINTSKNQLKKMKEMLEDSFANDATYKEHDKAVKEATKIRTATKSQIMKLPAVADLSSKIKELSADLKDAQGALSDYLREFQRLSGSNQITMDDGEVLEIVTQQKLVKRASRP